MSLLDQATDTRPWLFEGAMGTELIARGLAQGAPPETVTLDRPDLVRAIHSEYVAAGARVLKTNTFSANPSRLAQTGLVDRFEELNRRAAEIARNTADGGCWVAGVMGPTGILLSPTGAGDLEVIESAFRAQAHVLAGAGVDLLLIETMYDLREAQAALAACRDSAELPVIVTLTFTHTPHGFLTQTGDAAGDALKALSDLGADAVGTNCNLDSATAAALARRLREFLPDARLLIEPCAGQPRMLADGLEYPDGPAEFAEYMAPLGDLGVEMLGGCCGTSPAHIARLRDALRQRGSF
jgi:5-methyltetrahydrofolate--homocysteine methyltransferase